MKLLRSLQSLRPPVRTWAEAGFTAAVLGTVVALELLGRRLTSDVQDSLYALFLLGLIGGVVLWHRRRPVPWVGWLARRGAKLLKWLKTLRYAHGIDFRGTPPLPRRLPLGLWLTGVVFVLAAVGGAVGWEFAPGGWR